MVPDVAITLCERCCKFFMQDEYEFAYMEKGCCPFCKNIEKDKGVKNVYGSLADIHRWHYNLKESKILCIFKKIYIL